MQERGIMNLRLDDLRRGIRWWRREKDKWPQDFHNNVYYELYNLRRDGLTEGWWRGTVDRLWDWKAIRPKTKRDIQDRGLEIFGELQILYVNIATRTDHEPLFLDFIWNEIHEFYDILGSKTLHPQISPANWAISFFQSCSELWTMKRPE